jgi:hypothetical protein
VFPQAACPRNAYPLTKQREVLVHWQTIRRSFPCKLLAPRTTSRFAKRLGDSNCFFSSYLSTVKAELLFSVVVVLAS